jgi:hypothetical protein
MILEWGPFIAFTEQMRVAGRGGQQMSLPSALWVPHPHAMRVNMKIPRACAIKAKATGAVPEDGNET